MNRRTFATLLLSLLVLAAAPRAGAAGADLDQLRKSGVVGERWDGLVVLRSATADAGARALVESVNAKRSEIYRARAKTQGAPVTEVGKVYALEIAEKAPSGTWFLGEDGAWVQKK
ncbi:MAG: uncharacterized protein QOD06_1732 [Candidatus Binatota bacterium]|nr:uncharacterized protein [Candidatus Binatota bacterium]